MSERGWFDWVSHALALVQRRPAFILARDSAAWWLRAPPGSPIRRDSKSGWLRLASPAESDPWQIARELARWDEADPDPHLAALELTRLTQGAQHV